MIKFPAEEYEVELQSNISLTNQWRVLGDPNHIRGLLIRHPLNTHSELNVQEVFYMSAFIRSYLYP